MKRKTFLIISSLVSGSSLVLKGLAGIHQVKGTGLYKGFCDQFDRKNIVYDYSKDKSVLEAGEHIDRCITYREKQTEAALDKCNSSATDIMLGTTLITTSLYMMATDKVDSDFDISKDPRVYKIKEELAKDDE